MEMLGKIRRMYWRDRLSLHEITRRTGLSRNTIKKWIKAGAVSNRPQYRRRDRPGKLTLFEARLLQALTTDAPSQARPAHGASAVCADQG